MCQQLVEFQVHKTTFLYELGQRISICDSNCLQKHRHWQCGGLSHCLTLHRISCAACNTLKGAEWCMISCVPIWKYSALFLATSTQRSRANIWKATLHSQNPFMDLDSDFVLYLYALGSLYLGVLLYDDPPMQIWEQALVWLLLFFNWNPFNLLRTCPWVEHVLPAFLCVNLSLKIVHKIHAPSAIHS